MGAIQAARPEWGPYTLEMRRETFYLGSWHTAEPGTVPELLNPDAFTIPTSDAPALLATLEYALKWANTRAASVYVHAKPGEPWQLAEAEPGTLSVSGPFADLRVNRAGDADDPRVQLDAEVRYADLRPLRDALRPIADVNATD
ncbi:hypothetical protein ABZT26_25895 [Streptomyces sp. NPDC005395]|uniref:hypothetical protein n=1 Tax=Streptomyces sp. NPDC005395 TaxID=3157042 RepID=UPI0033BDA39C